MEMATRIDLQSESDSFKKAVGRVQKKGWDKLSTNQLQRMHDELEKKQARLREQVNDIEGQLDNALTRSNISDDEWFEQKHEKARRLERKYDQLEERRCKVYDRLQRRIITDGMISTLGTESRVLILEGTVLILIVTVLSLLTYEMFYSDELDPHLQWNFFVVDFIACLMFLSEFCLRLYHAEDKGWYWKHHWIDFVSSIPIPPSIMMVDYQRWARLIRLVRILRLWRALRLLRLVAFLWRGMERLQRVTNVKLMKKSVCWILTIIFVGALLIPHLEKDKVENRGKHDSLQIQRVDNFPKSLWWSFNTVATGGFGDLYRPRSIEGKLLTMLLILTGLVVTGVFIATLTAVYRGEDSEESDSKELEKMIASLQESQREIKGKLERIAQSVEKLG